MIESQALNHNKTLILKSNKDRKKFLLLRILEKLITNQVKVQVKIKVVIN